MLLDQVTPSGMTLSLFLLLLNIPIFTFGLRKQGITFTIYSIFTVGVYSLMSFMIINVFPIDVPFISPLAGSDLSLSRPLIREPDLIDRWQRGECSPAKCVSCNMCYRTPAHKCIFRLRGIE